MRGDKTQRDIINSLFSQHTYLEIFYIEHHLDARDIALTDIDTIPAQLQLTFLHSANRHASIPSVNQALCPEMENG